MSNVRQKHKKELPCLVATFKKKKDTNIPFNFIKSICSCQKSLMLAMFIEKMSEDFERPIKSPCKLYNSANEWKTISN